MSKRAADNQGDKESKKLRTDVVDEAEEFTGKLPPKRTRKPVQHLGARETTTKRSTKGGAKAKVAATKKKVQATKTKAKARAKAVVKGKKEQVEDTMDVEQHKDTKPKAHTQEWVSRLFSKLQKYEYAKPVSHHTVYVKGVHDADPNETAAALHVNESAPAIAGLHTLAMDMFKIKNAAETVISEVTPSFVSSLVSTAGARLARRHHQHVTLEDGKSVNVEYKVTDPQAWIASYNQDKFAALDELKEIFQNFKGQAKVDYLNKELLTLITNDEVKKQPALAAKTVEVLRTLYPWNDDEARHDYIINLHAINKAGLAEEEDLKDHPENTLVGRIEALEEVAANANGAPSASLAGPPVPPTGDFWSRITPEQRLELAQQQVKYTWAAQTDMPPHVGEHPGGIPEKLQKFNVIVRVADTAAVRVLNKLTRGFTRWFGRDRDADPRLEDFEDYYSLLTPKPALVEDKRWMSNQEFSNQRLRGVDPVTLKKINFDSLKAEFGAALDVTKINKQFGLSADGWKALNYFTVDYRDALDGLIAENGVDKYKGKAPAKPQALFAVVGGKLQVICIRLNWDPKKNPIFYTSDDDQPSLWLWVKMWFQNGEAQSHEIQAHLMLTHLMAEIFAVTTHRWIPESHFLHKLLVPHYDGTFFINDAARRTLLPDIIRGLMTCGYDGAVHLVNRTFYGSGDPSNPDNSKRYHFENSYLKKDLQDRGVDNPATLPFYPFRDMGVPVWNNIRKFVLDTLSATYASDEALQADAVVQNFFDQLKLEGQVFGVPETKTRESVADALTHIIWTCSAQHSVVNFRQYDFYGFIPNMPMSIYDVPPTNANAKQQNWDKFIASKLPGFDLAFEQLRIVRILTTTTSKGSTLLAFPTDVPNKELVEDFRQAMSYRVAAVKRANDEQPKAEKYDELNPNEIPMSISI